MPSTYTLNNGIELIGTGEQSGTWGDTTNTNLGLLDVALDGQVTVALASAGSSGSPNSLPISDGTASNGRNRMVVFSDSGDLGATAYVQLTPNDAEKIIYIRNSLSGSRSVILFQGTYNASNDYEVPAGTTAIVYFDGAGAGAVAANVFNNAYFDGLRLGSVSVTAILDEDNMASDSATALATQQSIKAYVDSQVGTVDTLAEILAIGNTTGATDISVDSAQKVQFRDAAIYINSSVDGQLDIVADTEIQIAATTVDVNGALDVSGTALVTGVLTTTAATVSNGGGQFNGAINVGVDDTGYDVKFFGATTGKSLLWDESADSLIVTGTTTLVGTTNLDAVDIDGATQIDATVTVGVDDTGYDVKFFGATAGAYMLWDESADDLILGGAAGLSVNSTALVTGVLTTTAATVFNGGFAAGGVGTFADGSNSAPSLTNTGDLNTGLYFPAADEVGLTVGGTQRLNVNATGIDVTGTGTFSGAITANDGILIPSGEANPVNAYGATTGGSAFAIANTGGTSYFGNESSVAGTSATGTSAYATIIGTGAARELNFFTNGVTRMAVSSSGDVGIGTSLPATTLDVNGTITAVGAITNNSGIVLQSSSVTKAALNVAAATDQGVTGTVAGDTYQWTTGGKILWSTDNGSTANLVINSAGDVGIGTSSPSKALDVVGAFISADNKTNNTDKQAVFLSHQYATTSEPEGFMIMETYAGAGDNRIDIGGGNSGYNSATAITFNTSSNTTTRTGTERMRVNSAGNVGIGNSLPLGRLTISNAAGTNAPSTVTAANTYLQLGSDDYGPSNNGKFMIGFGFTDATNTNSPAYIGYEEATTSGDTYGDLTFYTRSVVTDTAPTERMRIDSTGAVTMPYQPAFSVNNAPTTQANIAINTVVTITWAGERFDQNADFDLGANSFTAPVTGKYQFNLVIRLQDVDIDADYYIISIVTSNVEYKYIFDPVFASDPAYFTVNLSVLADLDASDTAYTTIYQGGGAAQTDITGDATYTYFTGYLVA
jgi:hypothetical protein